VSYSIPKSTESLNNTPDTVSTNFSSVPKSTNSSNKQTAIELAKYLMVSIVALGADYLTLTFLKQNLNANEWVSPSGGFLLGLIVNYTLSSIFVFKIKRNLKTFLEFSSVGVIGLIMTTLGYVFLNTQLGLDFRIAKLIMVIIVFIFNFAGRKYLFSTK
jgi:putative flippase GtrA